MKNERPEPAQITSEDREALRARVLKACEEAAVSLSAAEKEAGLATGTCSKWWARSGKPRSPQLEQLDLLGAVLKQPPEWFVEGTGFEPLLQRDVAAVADPERPAVAALLKAVDELKVQLAEALAQAAEEKRGRAEAQKEADRLHQRVGELEGKLETRARLHQEAESKAQRAVAAQQDTHAQLVGAVARGKKTEAGMAAWRAEAQRQAETAADLQRRLDSQAGVKVGSGLLGFTLGMLAGAGAASASGGVEVDDYDE